MKATVYGVGFNSGGEFKPSINGNHTKPYSTWKSMLMRCYSDKYHAKFPSYKECEVCDEWLDFQVFASWFVVNYIDGFQLDKDIKIDGNKLYSPSTCMFVSPFDNYEKAGAKEFKVVSPDGDVVSVYNMRKFCRDNNLNRTCMNKVLWGTQVSHKGWTIDVIAHILRGIV
tara:strand:+ start:198 stop:707 length:510 start_codon:yes stop_codon:yes gene_type:complete